MRAKIAMQALAHTAVTVNYIPQWANYLVANCAAKASTRGQAILDLHTYTLSACLTVTQPERPVNIVGL